MQLDNIKIYEDTRIVRIVEGLSIQVGIAGTGVIVTLNRENSFGKWLYIIPSSKEVFVDFDVLMGDTFVNIQGVIVGADDIDIIEALDETALRTHLPNVKKARRLPFGENWRY